MFYVGLDVHAKSISICILNDNGRVERRHKVDSPWKVVDTLCALPGPWQVCYEASTAYGTYFDLLSQHAAKVQVAHPGLLRLIYRSKQKNDRVDAEKLAKLLYLDQAPQVHVPSADVRAWRETINFRRTQIQKRTRAKNSLRCLLRSLCIAPPSHCGLWTRRGIAWLKALAFDSEMHAVKRDLLVLEIEQINDRLKRLEARLDRFAADHPAVQLLRSIPGVGPRTAEAVAAFIDDPFRFSNSKRVAAYFGLVPSQDQSSSINRLGHITRQGSATVRQLLVEAVWQASRRSPTVKAYLQRVQRADPERRKIAVVATAHYLLRVMWSMLKHGTTWEERASA